MYRDAESYPLGASYVKAVLKSLLDEVLKKLAGKGGTRVLKLMTPFMTSAFLLVPSDFGAGRPVRRLSVQEKSEIGGMKAFFYIFDKTSAGHADISPANCSGQIHANIPIRTIPIRTIPIRTIPIRTIRVGGL